MTLKNEKVMEYYLNVWSISKWNDEHDHLQDFCHQMLVLET